MQCLKKWVETEISIKNTVIGCPCRRRCLLQLELKEIESIVSRDYLEKHKSALMDLEVSKNKNLVWCPRPDCNTACNVADYSTNAVCPTCFKDFCVRCLKDWHFGSNCEEIDAFSDLNVKKCPTCSIPIQRNRGCQWMLCSRCRTGFCWFCLEVIWYEVHHYRCLFSKVSSELFRMRSEPFQMAFVLTLLILLLILHCSDLDI